MTPLSILCWRWKPIPLYRSSYPPRTVVALRDMVRRCYPHPHRFICITDAPHEIDPSIETIRDRGDHAALPSPHGQKNPSCYRRLRMFSGEMAALVGPRFVSLDLDTVLTDDVTPLWHRDEDIVLYGDTNPKTHYNGSMVLMTAGCRRKVWDEFDPASSPKKAKAAGFWGSDQAWLSYVLGGKEAKWTTADGVFSYRNHIRDHNNRLPDGSRLVVFHGNVDPWDHRGQSIEWVRRHYGVTTSEVAA